MIVTGMISKKAGGAGSAQHAASATIPVPKGERLMQLPPGGAKQIYSI